MTRLNPNTLATRNADLQQGLKPGPRLRELETIVARFIQGYGAAGAALREIKETRLYRERGYSSFDTYTREHWNIDRVNAHRMIEAAAVAAEVLSMDNTLPAPANVRQTRELAKAPEGERAEVWAEVVDQHEPQSITAAVIREHVEARRAPAEQPEPDDFSAYLSAVTTAVRTAMRAGATTQELYNAYQAGFH